MWLFSSSSPSVIFPLFSARWFVINFSHSNVSWRRICIIIRIILSLFLTPTRYERTCLFVMRYIQTHNIDVVSVCATIMFNASSVDALCDAAKNTLSHKHGYGVGAAVGCQENVEKINNLCYLQKQLRIMNTTWIINCCVFGIMMTKQLRKMENMKHHGGGEKWDKPNAYKRFINDIFVANNTISAMANAKKTLPPVPPKNIDEINDVFYTSVRGNHHATSRAELMAILEEIEMAVNPQTIISDHRNHWWTSKFDANAINACPNPKIRMWTYGFPSIRSL